MASSSNSFTTISMLLSIPRALFPYLPLQPALPPRKSQELQSASGSESNATNPHFGPPSKTMVITGRSPYDRPPESTPRPALKSSATVSIIEHAQMLSNHSLFTPNPHPLVSSTRRGTFNFPIPNRRYSSPVGNSSRSSSGGVLSRVTSDVNLISCAINSGGSGMLKDLNTPEDVQGDGGGTPMGLDSTSQSIPGTGIAGLSVGRGRRWTNPPSPTPPGAAIILGNNEPNLTRPRSAEVCCSGGNSSYPTNMRPTGPSGLSALSTIVISSVSRVVAPATPGLKKPDGLRKPTPCEIQPLTLPSAGG